jgi:hypothetical protein
MRDRHFIADGIKQICRVSRYICTQCRKTFTLLPHFLLSFKHYVVSEIEGVLRHLFDGGKVSESPSGADEGTIRRWRKEFSLKIAELSGMLQERLSRVGQSVPGLMQSLSHPLQRLEQLLACLPALPAPWTVITRTLWWLSISHPL